MVCEHRLRKLHRTLILLCMFALFLFIVFGSFLVFELWAFVAEIMSCSGKIYFQVINVKWKQGTKQIVDKLYLPKFLS